MDRRNKNQGKHSRLCLEVNSKHSGGPSHQEVGINATIVQPGFGSGTRRLCGLPDA